jgi:aminomethyltransferase (EC 2.1.2.10)
MRTPLYEEHVKLGAKFIDFHGWEMPIQYTSIIEEHKHVRSSVGLFDVSHMGDILIQGRDAASFMSYLLPSDILKAPTGKAIYSAYLNRDGKMIDDTIAYKISNESVFVIPNAATTEKFIIG